MTNNTSALVELSSWGRQEEQAINTLIASMSECGRCSEESETRVRGMKCVGDTTVYAVGGSCRVRSRLRRKQGAEDAQQRMILLRESSRGWRRRDKSGQGYGAGGLAPAALDALRPREAGLGAAQPGGPLVRSAPESSRERKPTEVLCAAPGPACGAGPTLARRSHSPCPGLSVSERPGGLVTARSPGWTRSQEDGHGGNCSLSLSLLLSLSRCPHPSGYFLWRALSLQSDRLWALKPHSAVSRLSRRASHHTSLSLSFCIWKTGT